MGQLVKELRVPEEERDCGYSFGFADYWTRGRGYEDVTLPVMHEIQKGANG
ncbi:hypothetical protein AB0D49_33275 [Streptomyces sp. NPDC048290]|uniref:hypothetical protein n=1 Tax=Streptomyces sp. NPDC048290 TaxID=3155811 RepID=UPI00341AAA37